MLRKFGYGPFHHVSPYSYPDASRSARDTRSARAAQRRTASVSHIGDKERRIAWSEIHPSEYGSALLSKTRALNYYKERTSWLENQLRETFGIDCADIANGTPLQPLASERPDSTLRTSAAGTSHPEALALSFEHQDLQNALTEPMPDASIVALNATGDARYLGPSSGIFFALYADTYSQLSGFPDGRGGGANRIAEQRVSSTPLLERGRSIDSTRATVLAQAFCVWVLPLYPIFSPDDVDSMVLRCITLEAANSSNVNRSPGESRELAMFYLVMTLGAIYEEDAAKRVRQAQATLSQDTSSASWYERALVYVNAGAKSLIPSVSLIQVLLLMSVYSMHSPVASTQWQLVGSALRVGSYHNHQDSH
jgi:hypothetical protein